MGELLDIKLSSEEYNYLVNEAHFFDYGSEARIIRDGEYAMKLFRKNFGQEFASEEEIEIIRENKRQKINLLYGMKDFDNEFKPLATYSYQGKFVGYKGLYLDYPIFFDFYLSQSEKIYYLKMVREKLALFHELGIVYGDVKSDNILIDREHNKIIFVDIDNMKVLNYPIDMVNDTAVNFLKKYGSIDEKMDSYMLNMLTIEQFVDCGLDYSNIQKMLEFGFIPSEIDSNRNKRLIREMAYINNDYSGEYLVDDL